MKHKSKLSLLDKTLIGFSILVMGYFGVPKLTGKYAETYNEFAKSLPIDGPTLMYTAGITELLIAALLLIGLLNKNNALKFIGLGFLLLIGTMLGALGTEFFLRPEPVWALVGLAIVLLFISFRQLNKIRNTQ